MCGPRASAPTIWCRFRRLPAAPGTTVSRSAEASLCAPAVGSLGKRPVTPTSSARGVAAVIDLLFVWGGARRALRRSILAPVDRSNLSSFSFPMVSAVFSTAVMFGWLAVCATWRHAGQFRAAPLGAVTMGLRVTGARVVAAVLHVDRADPLGGLRAVPGGLRCGRRRSYPRRRSIQDIVLGTPGGLRPRSRSARSPEPRSLDLERVPAGGQVVPAVARIVRGMTTARRRAASVNTRLRVAAAAAPSTSKAHGSAGRGIWMGQWVRSPTNTAGLPASSQSTDDPGVSAAGQQPRRFAQLVFPAEQFDPARPRTPAPHCRRTPRARRHRNPRRRAEVPKSASGIRYRRIREGGRPALAGCGGCSVRR